MNKYEFKKLKNVAEQIKKDDDPVYLKLIDVIYKCPNNSGQIIEADSIPPGSLVEEVNCTADDLFYFFCFNNKPTYTILD